MADDPDQHNLQAAMDLDDDPELALAIMLSMEQAQPGEEQPGPQPAEPQAQIGGPAPPPVAAAAAAPPSAPVDVAQLQQAIMQAMQQFQAAPGGQPQAQPPQAQAAGHRRHRSQAAAPAAQPMAPQPSWVQSAIIWPRSMPAPQDVTLPQNLIAAGSPVDSGFTASTGASLASAIQKLPLGSGQVLTWQWVKTTISRIPGGQNIVLAMQQAWLNASSAATAAGGDPIASAAVAMLRSGLAHRAARVLQEDEDDLFFEGGKSMAEFSKALENGQVAPGFLDAMVVASTYTLDAAEAAGAGKLWTQIIKDAFSKVESLDLSAPASFEGPLRTLDVLTQSPALRECLAALLLKDAAAGPVSGKSLESGCIIAPLLRLSALPKIDKRRVLPLEFPAKACFMGLRNYPRNRGSQINSEISSIRSSLQRVYSAAHEILKRIATLKPTENNKGGKEVVPAWLAAVTGANVARSEAGSYLDRVLSHKKATFECSSDAFLVAATAVGLRFCRPFMASKEKKEGASVHLDSAFYTKQAHRVVGVAAERTLAGSVAEKADGAAVAPYPAVSPDRPAEEAPHFVAEMFFATQRLIRVGVVPAIYRFQALAKMMRRQAKQGAAAEEEEGDQFASEKRPEASLEEWLLGDSVRSVLVDPDLGNDLVQFCELTARWVLSMLRQGGPSAAAAAAVVPESAVRDMCVVLQYFIHQRATELLGGADIGVIISCLTALLRATDAIPSPAVHFSVVQLLLAMLSPQLGVGFGRARHFSPAEAALVSAVLGTGAAQTELLPALMAAYTQADHVVGLDVDKDAYDKFSMRTQIDLLLMELWKDPACARSLDAVAAATTIIDSTNATSAGSGSGDSSLFPDFCGAVLNDLIYLLKDSLGRLEDLATLERSIGDTTTWAAQPPKEREDKMTFYRSQQGTVRGFMSMALTTLQMLNTLVASRAVQSGFVGEEVAPRAAGAAFHFIDLLVGPRCEELAVLRNPGQYHFDPDQLLLSMLMFMLRLAEQPFFVAAMAGVADYDSAVLIQAAKVLKEKQLGEYEHRQRLKGLVAAVEQRRREAEAAGDITFGSNVGHIGASGGGTSALAMDMLDSEAAVTTSAQIELNYSSTVGPLAVGEFDSSLPRAYNRHFAVMAETAAGDVSKAAKRLSRELRDLSGKMALPLYAGGAVLVRHDIVRLDKVRALITGPEGTPYESGCFFFDVFFPPQYPNAPPLMELETTGGGVARFNPNLYADGKVCLSLLGTWHGGDASEKWNPSTSTLWQVLLSIQSQVLVPEPYYNEPAYEGMRGTTEGDAASLKYNAEIWLANMRYAMADVLRHPRAGFEEAIAAHFKALRPRIVKRMAGWVESAAPLGPAMQNRLEKAAAEVRSLLAAL